MDRQPESTASQNRTLIAVALVVAGLVALAVGGWLMMSLQQAAGDMGLQLRMAFMSEFERAQVQQSLRTMGMAAWGAGGLGLVLVAVGVFKLAVPPARGAGPLAG